MTVTKDELLPAKAIRRFDVFAEFKRQERIEKGDAEDVAKGYGIWIAKVVASRSRGEKSDEGDSGQKASYPETKFRSIGGDEQTDFEFDLEIIERMGKAFYKDVFSPAIEEARADGKKYEEIRDEIRADWKPAKRKR